MHFWGAMFVVLHQTGFSNCLFFPQTRNPHVYELLMDMRDKLEEKFESLNLQNSDHAL